MGLLIPKRKLRLFKISFLIVYMSIIAVNFGSHDAHIYDINQINYVIEKKSGYTYSNDWPEILCNRKLISTNTKDIKIAILDTGIDFSNPLLKNSKLADIDISGEKTYDRIHGTIVAEILASKGNELAGILPKVKLVSIKLGTSTGWKIEKLEEGIDLAIKLKVDIINLSCGTSFGSKRLRDLIKKATKNNIVVVAAAGNNGINNVDFPAAYEEVLSVGGVDVNYQISSYSNYSKKINIYAPGEDILAIIKNGNVKKYIRVNGTSVATPFVTGLVAILKTKYPFFKPSDIKNKILESSNVIRSRGQNIRVINFYKSLL